MKTQLLDCLRRNDFEGIDARAQDHKRILSLLTAITYDPDDLIAWRAVQAIGIAARVIALKDPEYVRVHLRRLNWLVNDESGGIGWRAPETIAEIIFQCPGQFDEFISPLFHFLDMEQEDAPRFRPGVLWGIGRLVPSHPDAITPVLHLVFDCLRDPQAQVRGLALWCLDQADFVGPIPGRQALCSDQESVLLYCDGVFQSWTVARLAGRFC